MLIANRPEIDCVKRYPRHFLQDKISQGDEQFIRHLSGLNEAWLLFAVLPAFHDMLADMNLTREFRERQIQILARPRDDVGIDREGCHSATMKG